MGFRPRWIKRVFRADRADEEAAEHEEFGFPDRGEQELRWGRLSGRYTAGAVEAAEDELDAFKPPPDPNP